MIYRRLCVPLSSLIFILLLFINSGCSSSQTDMVKVSRVIDGDTIVIASGEHVRYIGIDTPELNPEEPYAREALTENRHLVEGKLVRLEKDVSDKDRYGRLLRYVYVDGLMVNAELVRLGLARATAYPPDTKYQQLLKDSEGTAKRERRGIWSAAGISYQIPSFAGVSP